MIQDIAPAILDNQYNSSKSPQKGDYIMIYHKNKLILLDDNQLPTLEYATEKWNFNIKKYTYLLSVDDISFFLVLEKVQEVGCQYQPIQVLRKLQSKSLRFASATAIHLGWWYESHKFCGLCGSKNYKSTTERALICSKCAQIIYPEIAPAIIVAVINKDKILLTKFLSGYKNYALISGYVEIGETLENTVKREVSEEVGLSVHNIQYYDSQPWAFSHSLLMGFVAHLDEDIKIDLEKDELSMAEWFDRNNLPKNDSALSLTWSMIESFRNHEF